MKAVTLTVDGMSCGHCINAIEGALKSIKAIGHVNLANKTVQVEYNETETSLESIKQTIEDQGYVVR